MYITGNNRGHMQARCAGTKIILELYTSILHDANKRPMPGLGLTERPRGSGGTIRLAIVKQI